RYRTNNSNQKPLERTQNWIKLGGKVNLYPQKSSNDRLTPDGPPELTSRVFWGDPRQIAMVGVFWSGSLD
ncbi:hypothetical protein ACC699_36820, partial [Rhizobium ruizarguesonis]